MVKLASSQPEKQDEAIQAFLKVRTILVLQRKCFLFKKNNIPLHLSRSSTKKSTPVNRIKMLPMFRKYVYLPFPLHFFALSNKPENGNLPTDTNSLIWQWAACTIWWDVLLWSSEEGWEPCRLGRLWCDTYTSPASLYATTQPLHQHRHTIICAYTLICGYLSAEALAAHNSHTRCTHFCKYTYFMQACSVLSHTFKSQFPWTHFSKSQYRRTSRQLWPWALAPEPPL